MNVLYIGDFIKNNGPATVDKNLKKNLPTNVNYCQSNDFSTILRDIKYLLSSDVVHCSGVSFKALILFILSLCLLKKRTFTMHGYLLKELENRSVSSFRILMEKILIVLASRIFPVSENLKNSVLGDFDRYSGKFIAIPNGTTPLLSKKHYSDGSNSVVCIGGGRPEKQIYEVCSAVERINASKNLDIKVYVFGEDGKDSERIKKLDCVIFLGFVNKEELNSYLKRASIFVQYSSYEPFSLSVFEALSQGCYVLCSNMVGALDYIVTRNSVRVVPFNNSECLDFEIFDILGNKDNLEQLIDTNVDHLTWELVSEQYKGCWYELLNA